MSLQLDGCPWMGAVVVELCAVLVLLRDVLANGWKAADLGAELNLLACLRGCDL